MLGRWGQGSRISAKNLVHYIFREKNILSCLIWRLGRLPGDCTGFCFAGPASWGQARIFISQGRLAWRQHRSFFAEALEPCQPSLQPEPREVPSGGLVAVGEPGRRQHRILFARAKNKSCAVSAEAGDARRETAQDFFRGLAKNKSDCTGFFARETNPVQCEKNPVLS